MSENLAFHFEGALADSHRMNFYESARFQYAAARLMVKLAQFRRQGKFVQKITNLSNFSIQLVGHTPGSFNINIEDTTQVAAEESFINISLSDLIAYVSERLVEKIDEAALENIPPVIRGRSDTSVSVDSDIPDNIDELVEAALENRGLISSLPPQVQDLIKRRAAETYRQKRLLENEALISRIDFARSQKLIAMSAPLVSEMATALRRSANSLEITSSVQGRSRSVLFLDQKMAQDIETAIVDKEITPILGNVIQFNKDNGWGKLRLTDGIKTVSFSIPYDILPTIRQVLIQSMQRDQVFLQTYLVRDRSNEIVRLIAVGVLPTPVP